MQYRQFVKGLVCGALGLIAICASSQAQEIFVPTNPADWSGPYIGVNFGYLANHYDVSSYHSIVDLEKQFYGNTGETGEIQRFEIFDVPSHSSTEGGFTGGGQAGYLFQFGHFVVGAEGDFNGASNDNVHDFHGFQSTNTPGGPDIQSLFRAETTFQSIRQLETNWNASARGLLGYAWGPWLFYITGGAAFTDLRVGTIDRANTTFFGFDGVGNGPISMGRFVSTQVTEEDNDLMVGWTGGGGVQIAFNKVMSMGVEYRHSGYDGSNFHFHTSKAVLPGNTNVDLDSDVVLLKINLLLGRIH